MTEPPPDIPPRLTDALAGRYRIVRELGEGGMATVWLADDLKHERKVAIKVLKPELAALIGGERFVVEIKTTAGLQHPHILPLFDSGEADGFLYYVMPYVEGESLRDRLDRERQLGVDDALSITRDVADALDYAHRNGVIHRDIKPENILLHDGRPVVADFGIAVAISAAGGGRMTETGLSLGTPHYMSPEQATAERELTARSDVYSLACVLYEMLAGDPPHTGPNAQAVLVRILTETPRPVTDTRTSVPPHVAAVLARALEKLPADRFESASDFRDALDRTDFQYAASRRARGTRPTPEVAGSGDTAVGGGRRSAGLTRWAPWAVAAAAAFLAGWGWLRPEAPGTTATLFLDLGDLTVPPFEWVRVSPDGRGFAVVADTTETGRPGRLFVRRIDEESFRPLTGPGAEMPSFSPDGRWLVYGEDDGDRTALRRVSVDGGQPTTLVQRDGFRPSEVTWGDDGFIYFWATGGDADGGIYRVPETGGRPELLVGDAAWAYLPSPLPGGRGVLLVDGREDPPALALYDMEADTVRRLVPEASRGVYVETGHLVFGHPAGGLQGVSFDLDRLEVTGSPIPLRDGVSVDDELAFFSVSRGGTLTYLTGRSGAFFGGDRHIVEYDLESHTEREIRLPPRFFLDVRYSPDGRRVAFSASDDPDEDLQLFVHDIELGTTPRQITFEGATSGSAWSPDGSRLVQVRRDGEEADLWIRELDEDVPSRRLTETDGVAETFPSWTTEGVVLYERTSASGNDDLWMLDPIGEPEPVAYLTSEFDLTEPAVSPDGRFAAYESDELDTEEIFVRTFPDPGQPSRVSVGGGSRPRWTPDGRGLYFWRLSSAGAALHLAHVRPDPVFAVDSTTLILSERRITTNYDVHPTGDRLLLVKPVGADESDESVEEGPPEEERFVVVLNWFEEMKERLGTGGGR